jgi:hypothetical protein
MFKFKLNWKILVIALDLMAISLAFSTWYRIEVMHMSVSIYYLMNCFVLSPINIMLFYFIIKWMNKNLWKGLLNVSGN